MGLAGEIGKGFGLATGRTSISREIKMVGDKAVKNLLIKIREDGKRPHRANVVFRESLNAPRSTSLAMVK